MWQDRKFAAKDESFNHLSKSTTSSSLHNNRKLNLGLPGLAAAPYSNSKNTTLQRPAFSGIFDDDLVAENMVLPLTVVLEGRSICHRISLHKHDSYESLARALRQMFVDNGNDDGSSVNVDLSNAVPGHLIAYEDMENDLLLVGDLKWKDFVRVAKRIRILPAKAESRKQKHK